MGRWEATPEGEEIQTGTQRSTFQAEQGKTLKSGMLQEKPGTLRLEKRRRPAREVTGAPSRPPIGSVSSLALPPNQMGIPSICKQRGNRTPHNLQTPIQLLC